MSEAAPNTRLFPPGAVFSPKNFPSSPKKFRNRLKQVLFNTRAGNPNLAKSLGEKRNHTVYQDKNPHRGLLSLQN